MAGATRGTLVAAIAVAVAWGAWATARDATVRRQEAALERRVRSEKAERAPESLTLLVESMERMRRKFQEFARREELRAMGRLPE